MGGGGRRRRIRAARGRQAGNPVAPPATNVLWMICCQQGHSATGVRLWWDYANRSNHGFIVRMNGQLANTRTAHERQPRARLNTLDNAVARAQRLAHVNNSTLVMFMHGVAMGNRSFGIIHGGTRMPIDLQHIAQNRNWNGHVLPFMWPTRNRNVHYTAFAQAVRGWANISKVHIYGCQIGNAFLNCGQAILDFATDTGKEIWAYQNFTYTTARQLTIIETRTSRTAVVGAVQRGARLVRVNLQANGGLLPGWQVRGYTQGGVQLVDIIQRGSFGGYSVITHNRNTLTQTQQNPIFANPLRRTTI